MLIAAFFHSKKKKKKKWNHHNGKESKYTFWDDRFWYVAKKKIHNYKV